MLVAERGLAESREQAQRLILAGSVRVDGRTVTKAGQAIAAAAVVEVTAQPRFVSRGGEKLDAAFEAFGVSVAGLVCLDAGASTGGFTDCMLRRGAERVIAVDVGKGQLHWRLRTDPRVTPMEGVNARYLTAAMLDAVPRFAAVDCSFISLTKVLPAVISVLVPGSSVVALIKPQFEAGRSQVEKGGVVKDPAVHEAVVRAIREFVEGPCGARWRGVTPSPLRGPAGNIEFLAWFEVAS